MISGLLVSGACADESAGAFQIDTGETHDTPQPLTLFSVDARAGIAGEYAHHTGERLAFETRHEREADGTLRVSARIYDMCNVTFAYVAEGHAPPEWTPHDNCVADVRPFALLPALERGLRAEDLPHALERDRMLLLAAIDDAHYAREALMGMNGGQDVYGPQRRARGGALKTQIAGLEFKHVIELWSQQFRVPLINKVTVNHHSGTFDRVYKRPIGSDALWEIQETGRNCNHGACPWEEEMKKYATCEDTPVTQGVYAIRTDCTGLWGINHVCNDDSALQINQAYGRGLGVTHCSDKKRANRPWCGVQW